jgi:F1F0 ATPase subunit 2
VLVGLEMDAQAMIDFHLTAHNLIVSVLSAGSWLATGMVIGAFHFLTLRWNVRMLTAGRSPLPAVAVQLGRFAALAFVLAGIARYFGALPLLADTAGVLVARTVITRFGA